MRADESDIQSATNTDYLAGDITAHIGSEKKGCVCNLTGTAEPSQRDFCQKGFSPFFIFEIMRHIRFNKTRSDGIATDIATA